MVTKAVRRRVAEQQEAGHEEERRRAAPIVERRVHDVSGRIEEVPQDRLFEAAGARHVAGDAIVVRAVVVDDFGYARSDDQVGNAHRQSKDEQRQLPAADGRRTSP